MKPMNISTLYGLARSLCRQAVASAFQNLFPEPHSDSSARETGPVQAACTSVGNTAETATEKGLVRITHPFHPYGGRRLPCVGERYNRSGKRLLLQVGENLICSVPESWTDLVDADPEIVAGDKRALLRFADLLELARLVERLIGQNARRNPDDV